MALAAAINGIATPTSTTSFDLDSGLYTCAGNAVVAGRATADGTTPIIITAIGIYVAGHGGARTMQLYVSSNYSTPFAVAADSNAQYYPVALIVPVLTGGTIVVGVSTDGPLKIGRAASLGQSIERAGVTRYANAMMPGYYNYVQSPTAPQSLVCAPSGSSIAVSWAAPADDGGDAINGYTVRWRLNPAGAWSQATTVGTSYNITGLTPGATYDVQVGARNDVNDYFGVMGVPVQQNGISLGTVPGAPTGVTITTGRGLANIAWTAPASDGGVPISGYRVDYALDSGFTSGLVSTTVASTARTLTVVGLTPGTTYYTRVVAINGVGNSAASASANAATPTRDTLDIVRGASVHLADGTQVELRSDGANNPAITLGYTAFGTGTAFTSIATIPDGASATDFGTPGGTRNLALVADPAGNLYVIGRRGDSPSVVLVRRYERTGPTTWALDGTLSQALASTGDALVAFAATYVPGTGFTPTPTILVLARRAGTVGPGSLSYATLNLTAIEASAGTMFLASGSDPSWLATPPASAPASSGVVDAAPLVSGGTRIALLANGFAVVDVVNGVVSGVSKAAAGTTVIGPWARVIGVNATTLVVLSVTSGALAWAFYSSAGSLLGSGTYAGANAQGGAFASQWDAYYDTVAQSVTIYYVADDSARKLESIDVSPVLFTASAAAVLTSALGAASSVNSDVRIPEGAVDERRVLVAAGNILTGTKSTAAYVDTTGNAVPNAPAVVDQTGYDAANAQLFAWAFGDPNPADTQTAYELQVQRVSDSVDIVATGKVASTTSSRNIVAATLTNGVNYRWRVRTWDALDTVGAWSAYDTFTTSALGTLTITTPAADNPAGLETSSLNVVWSYVQANGYTQTQRRVRVIRQSDSVVLSDTTMQASAVGNYTVTGLPTDVEVRIEVTIVTNAPGTPTVGPASRKVTPSYGTPMTPVALLVADESCIEIAVTNPAPTGSRPQVAYNIIERRPTGSSEPYLAVGSVGLDGVYRDHAVRSGQQYDYRVRGVTA